MEKYLFKGDESVVERTNHKPGVSMDHLNLFIFLVERTNPKHGVSMDHLNLFISHEQINDIIALISLTLAQTWNVRRQISSHWVVSPSGMCRMFILLLLLNFMGTSLCKNIRIIVCRFLFYIVLFHVLAENSGSRALMLKSTIHNS